MQINEFHSLIKQWAEERGIFQMSDPLRQWDKTWEETEELLTAIRKRDREGVKDAIGDIIVTLAIQAEMQGLTLEECMMAAWQEIKNRRGKMVNGVFVKEGGSHEQCQDRHSAIPGTPCLLVP